MSEPVNAAPEAVPPGAPAPRRHWVLLVLAFVLVALATFGVTALLTSIFTRQQEARLPFVRLVEVDETTTDPAVWGVNWPHEYDGYKRTAEATQTKYGGSALGGGDAMPQEKLDRDPWLKRMFAGYAFSLDYRDRRGHAFMLLDQEKTERVNKKPQPGACLHCHAAILPAYRFAGQGDVQKGFEAVCAMPYKQAHDLVNEKGAKLITHPVSCMDCHDPKTMELRVTRPAFLRGITALKAKQGVPNYDANHDATRQEMRAYVCAQCHVEYYFKGKEKIVTFPWDNGLRVEEIEKYYDDAGFSDWTHAETQAQVLKAQHPEFEVWNQGLHAQSGVACADCHMPYYRVGAMKVSDHWVRSPLLNVSRACQQCHPYPEAELLVRATSIQDRHHALLERTAKALMDLLDALVAAEKRGATPEELKSPLALQRQAQWRMDFVAAENSMGFHAPQELARVLAEAIDLARQGQLAAQSAHNVAK